MSELSDVLQKGAELMRHKSYRDAMELFRQAVRESPRSAEAFLHLGKCCFIQKHFQPAKTYLHRALELDPSPDVIRGLLSVTNWCMAVPPKYYNGSPSFSPDGSMLAFVSARRDTNNDGLINALDRGGIYVHYVETGREVCVVPDLFANFSPVFSPDGTKLAYLSSRPQDQASGTMRPPALYLMDLANGRETLLAGGMGGLRSLSFHPDGRRLIFAAARAPGHNRGVYALDIETGRATLLVDAAFNNAFPSVSPDGRTLLFASWRRDTNNDGGVDVRDNAGIYLRDLENGSERCIAADTCSNLFPAFSPGGSRIVFHSVRRDTNQDGRIDAVDSAGIYVHDLVHEKEYAVVDDSRFNKFQSWMPGETSVLFISNQDALAGQGRGNGYFEFKGVYVAGVEDGGAPRQLVCEECYGCRSLAVSPRTGRVAYVSWHHDTARGLYVARLDGLPDPGELRGWIDKNF